MEYLMTYGWAILIILIAAGALFYLGVFDTDIPNSCSIPAPFVCRDVIVNENGILFNLGAGANTQNALVIDVKINGESCSDLGGFLYNTDIDEESYSGCAINLSDEKVSGSVDITYNIQNSLDHNINGDFSGNVEERSIASTVQNNGIFHLSDENLIFGWDGESVNDYAGGLVGIPAGGLNVPNTEGYLGGGTEFDGVNDNLNFGNKFYFNISDPFTYSVWFYWNGNESTGGNVFGLASKSVSSGFDLLFLSNNLRFSLRNTVGNELGISNATIFERQWYHAVGVFDPANDLMSLYVNGKRVEIRQVSELGLVSIMGSTNNFGIGENTVGGNFRTFNGTIDEVAIWNRALSGDEIQNLYNSYI